MRLIVRNNIILLNIGIQKYGILLYLLNITDAMIMDNDHHVGEHVHLFLSFVVLNVVPSYQKYFQTLWK